MSKSRVTWKDVVPPLVAITLTALLILGTIQVATQNGWDIGVPPWLTGQNGTGGTGTGTGNTAIIPTGQLSFKMVISADYVDGTSEQVFEKSTMQGFGLLNNPNVLGLIQLRGKPVKDTKADAMVALAFDQPLPTGTKTHFLLNYTVYVSDPNACQHISYGQTLCQTGTVNWKARSAIQNVDADLLQNNTMAFVVLPTSLVSSTDIFPTDVTSATNRTVLWTLDAKVTVSGPNLPQFALTGSSLSNAMFNADGTITVCTDCGPPGSGGGIGGVALGGGRADFDVPDYCSTHPSAAQCGGGGGQTTQATANTVTGPAIPVYIGITNSYTMSITQSASAYIGNNPYPGATTQIIPVTNSYSQCVANCPVSGYSTISANSKGQIVITTRYTKSDGSVGTGSSTTYETTETDSSEGFGAAKNPGDYGLRPRQVGGLPMELIWQFDMGTTTIRINLWTWILAFIIGGVVVLIFWVGYFAATHKRKRRH